MSAADLKPLEETSTLDGDATDLDHYFCRKCWPEPQAGVVAICGTRSPVNPEIMAPEALPDCIVCHTATCCPTCGDEGA